MRHVHRVLALSPRSCAATAALAGDGAGAAAAECADLVTGPDQTLFNEAVLIYSNAVRRSHGRPPLAARPGLSRAAAEHALNMARLRTHSHELPVRGPEEARAAHQAAVVSYRQAAENIAMDKVYRLLGRPISMSSRGCDFLYGDTMQPVPVHTYASLAEQVVSRWLASPKHRASLLSPTYQRLGAGVGVDPRGAGLRRLLPRAGLRRLSRRQLLATRVAGR